MKTTTRHSWTNTRTDTDGSIVTDFDTCRVCALIRITIKCPVNKTFCVTYVEPDGTEHPKKVPYPCKSHCAECKQTVEIAFTEL